MEEIKKPEDAWEGHLIEYKNRIYRVVSVYSHYGFKAMKVVSAWPRFLFAHVKKIITSESYN